MSNAKPTNENTKVIDALVHAYNSGNADAFAELFAEDAIAYEHPNIPAQIGREGIRAFYKKRFAEFPQNRTQVLHRIIIGDYVIDHERSQRSPDHEPFDVVAINELRDGFIQRLDLVRKA